ncbi:MAG: MFS transporter [bacterium]|nr:MFS transporter [bacterium]MBK8127846.1 MFS transporter [bacterium]
MPRRFRIEPLLIFLTMLPVTGVVPILKSFVMDGFGVSGFWTHAFLAANMLAAFLFAPIAGGLADRMGRPKLFVAIAAALDGLCFLLMPHIRDFTVLMSLRFVEGVFHIGTLSLLLAVAGARGAEGRSAAMGRVGAAITFGVALGSPIGGWLGSISPFYSLSLGGVLMIAVGVLTALLDMPSDGLARRQPLGAILANLAREPRLRLPYLFAFLDRFTVGFFVASFPILATLKFGFTPGQIGGHIAAFMLTMGLLCPPVIWLARRFSQTQMLLWGSLSYGLLFAGVGWIAPPWLMVWMFALGATSAVMFIPTLQLSAAFAPIGQMAASMGGFTSAGSLGFLLGPLVSGTLLSLLSGNMTTEAAYAIVLCCGGLLQSLVAGGLIVRASLAEREPTS